MFKFENNAGIDLSVIGHVLIINRQLIDMRTPHWMSDVIADREELWTGRTNFMKNGQSPQELIKSFVSACQSNNNWGNNEQDFDSLVKDKDVIIRAAVALNGKYAEKLSNDEQYLVRLNTILSLSNDKSRGVKRDDSFIHYMIKDPIVVVRVALASYGNEEQLNELIKDDYLAVRLAVAKHNHSHHLASLIDDESCSVRQWIAANGTIAQAQKLASDSSVYVRKVVASRSAELDPATLGALATDSVNDIRQAVAEFAPTDIASQLVTDTDMMVRVLLARRGIALETLKSDESANVRSEVAKAGYALDELAQDASAEVRAYALAYPAILDTQTL